MSSRNQLSMTWLSAVWLFMTKAAEPALTSSATNIQTKAAVRNPSRMAEPEATWTPPESVLGVGAAGWLPVTGCG